MEAFQQRVVDEKTELDSKRAKLVAFLGTEEFADLPDAERERLMSQNDHMLAYSQILGERIAAF